jgi:hypothetical protein
VIEGADAKPAAARGSRSERLRVERPSPNKDRPQWWSIALVGGVALAVGYALPRAACGSHGAEPAPEEPATAASASAEPSVSGEPSTVALSPSADAGVADAPSESPAIATIAIGRATLAHCQDPPAAELKPSKCGDQGFDAYVVSKLQQLSTCQAVSGLAGKLSVGVDVNFTAQTLKVTAAKSSSLQRAGKRDDKAIEPVLACVRTALADLPTGPAEAGSGRQHARYLVYYPVTITPAAGAAPAPSGSAINETSVTGTATVQVDTAIVRDEPRMTGHPIGRLSRGTKVTTIGTFGHWFHVRFGDNDAQDGWVFRTNIGK